MVNWAALAAAGAGGAANYFGSKSAADEQADLLKEILRNIRQLKGEQRISGGQALKSREKALRAIQAGFGGALAETARMGDATETAIRDQAGADFDAAQQMLITRGQFNPGHLTWARQGVSSKMLQLIGLNNQKTAAQRAAILTQGGLAEAGGYGGIADQIGANFNQRAALFGAQNDVLSSMQPYAQDYGEELGWLFGSFANGGLDFGGGGSSAGVTGGGQFAGPNDTLPPGGGGIDWPWE